MRKLSKNRNNKIRRNFSFFIFNSSLVIAFLMLNLTSCIREEFDAPPSNCDEINLTSNFTIADLKAMYDGSDTVRITGDSTLYVTVISSDRRGNFYKQLIVQDETGGISISVDASYLYETYEEGQKLFIKCKDLYIGKSGGIPVLGYIYDDNGTIKHGRIPEEMLDDHIIRTCDVEKITPQTYTIPELKANDTLLNTLIQIENVQFKQNQLGTTFAVVGSGDPNDENRTLIDTAFNEIILRTSQYSDFAADSLPTGSGSITAVFGKYNSDYQLYIKYTDWIDFSNERFYEPYSKDFEDQDIYSGGWTTQIVEGTANWKIGDYGNYAQVSSYYESDQNSEVWYISPEFDLTIANNPTLSFTTAMNYGGYDLEVKYSTDYDGTSNPTNFTWVDLSPALSTGDWNWVNSGDLTLPSQKVYVSFVYKGAPNQTATWEVDDIQIK